jgi:histidinol-phosphate/aromatic aminotransferase/cobyric acid decarboxylase-like protein/choline kinase
MKAIVLAAGYGNRMRPLTDTVHKTLLSVAGETIIDRIVSSLDENGVTDIVVVTGYRADELGAHLRTAHPQARFTFVHNPRYRETNNIYSLALAMNEIEIDDDVLLIESDLIYEDRVLERILRSPHPNVALLDRFRSGMDGTVVTVAEGIVTSIIPSYLQDAGFDFSDKYKTLNIYKFSRDFCRTSFRQLLSYYTKVIDQNSYYELVLGILIYLQKETIHAEVLDGEHWAEVDDPNDLHVAEFVFNRGERRRLLEETFGGYWAHDVLDFAFIRNMYFPTAAILSELRSALPALIHNYGSRQSILDRKLSYFLRCPSERVVLLNGAAQVFPFLRGRFGPGDVLIPTPTFGEYPRVFGARRSYEDRGELDLAGIEAAAAGARAVVFVNPNNPTGSLVATDRIHEFAARHPELTVIVDESFIDFAGCPSVMERLEERPLPNVVVIKSLSKALGVPGIRLGFVYTVDEEFARALRDTLPIWNVNSLAEHYLEVILKHRGSLAASFTRTCEDRDALAARLASRPFVERVYPSAGNFLLVTFRDDPRLGTLVSSLLARHSIYVKDVGDKLDGRFALRLAVRLPQEHDRLVAAIDEHFAAPAAGARCGEA